jgi:hypothetical protein
MLILLMQVIWLYVDELIGKGLDWLIIAELDVLFFCKLNSPGIAFVNFVIIYNDLW